MNNLLNFSGSNDLLNGYILTLHNLEQIDNRHMLDDNFYSCHVHIFNRLFRLMNRERDEQSTHVDSSNGTMVDDTLGQQIGYVDK